MNWSAKARHAQNAPCGPVGRLDDQIGKLGATHPEERTQTVIKEDPIVGVAPALRAVHPLHDLGVQDEPGSEREVSLEMSMLALGGDASCGQELRLASLDDLEQLGGGFDEIVWEAEVAGQDVRGPAGQDSQDNFGGGCGMEQAVDDLVDGSVAAVGDDGLRSGLDRLAGQGRGMSAGVGCDPFELEGRFECALGDAQGAGGDVSGLGVLYKDGVHSGSLPNRRWCSLECSLLPRDR